MGEGYGVLKGGGTELTPSPCKCRTGRRGSHRDKQRSRAAEGRRSAPLRAASSLLRVLPQWRWPGAQRPAWMRFGPSLSGLDIHRSGLFIPAGAWH